MSFNSILFLILLAYTGVMIANIKNIKHKYKIVLAEAATPVDPAYAQFFK